MTLPVHYTHMRMYLRTFHGSLSVSQIQQDVEQVASTHIQIKV